MFGAAVTVPTTCCWPYVGLYWPVRGHMPSAVALCLQAGLSEVLYCTICANATQHAATNAIWHSASHLGHTTPDLPRPQRTVDHGDHIAIYGAFFIMFARKSQCMDTLSVNRNDLFFMACILLFV